MKKISAFLISFFGSALILSGCNNSHHDTHLVGESIKPMVVDMNLRIKNENIVHEILHKQILEKPVYFNGGDLEKARNDGKLCEANDGSVHVLYEAQEIIEIANTTNSLRRKNYFDIAQEHNIPMQDALKLAGDLLQNQYRQYVCKTP